MWLEVAGVLRTPATLIIFCLYFNCKHISTPVPMWLSRTFWGLSLFCTPLTYTPPTLFMQSGLGIEASCRSCPAPCAPSGRWCPMAAHCACRRIRQRIGQDASCSRGDRFRVVRASSAPRTTRCLACAPSRSRTPPRCGSPSCVALASPCRLWHRPCRPLRPVQRAGQ